MATRTMFRGDTLAFTVQVNDPTTGAPRNLAGWKFYFTVKRFAADPDQNAVFQDNTASGSGAVAIVAPAALGQVAVSMPAAKTVLFPDTPTTLVYDVEGIDASGNVSTVEGGTIKVTPDVTRAVT